MLATFQSHEVDSVISNTTFGTISATRVHIKRVSGEPKNRKSKYLSECFKVCSLLVLIQMIDCCKNNGLKRFVQSEPDGMRMFAHAEVYANVDALFEFPSVSDSVRWQQAMTVDLMEMVKYGTQTGPHHQTVASPDMLTKLYHCVNFVFGTVASFVVTSYTIGLVERREHRPGGIPVCAPAV